MGDTRANNWQGEGETFVPGPARLPASEPPSVGHKQSSATREALERLRSRRNVGRAIIGRRVELKLSQADVAARARTKQSRISEMETLEGNVRFDTLERVAAALDLEVMLLPIGPPLCSCANTPDAACSDCGKSASTLAALRAEVERLSAIEKRARIYLAMKWQGSQPIEELHLAETALVAALAPTPNQE